MRAAVYHGPDDLRMEQRDVSPVEAGEVLIRVLASGICGTDLRILHGAHRAYPPGTVRIPGHEIAGEIAAIGAGVANLAVGQRVVVAPNWGCGRCRQCITGQNNRCASFGALGISVDGGFAEYVRVPAPSVGQGNLIPIDGSVDPATAALTEPLACVVRGQSAVGDVHPEDVVLVLGAGPIGILHTMLARLQGSRCVIVAEMTPARLGKAAEAGADRLVDLTSQNVDSVVREMTGGEGADVVIVAAPAHAAQQDAIRLAAIGGRISFFGGLPKDKPLTELDANAIHYKELVVTGTSACSTADCWKAAAILQSGRLNLEPMISKRFALQDTREAFDAAAGREALKVLIET